MSFGSAAELAERYAKRFDEVRSRALKSVTRSQAITFDSIYELLTGVSSVVKVLATLEGSLGSEIGSKKVCGNAVFVRSQDSTIFMRLKPLRAVTYSASQGLLRLTFERVSVEVTSDSITVTLGRISQKIPYTDPADVANNASMYRAVVGKALPVTGELMTAVVSCAKAAGVRL
jgi:hypothetical protein